LKELRFGYYDCIITPPVSIGLAGYEKRDVHGFGNSGVIDELYARALSLKSGNIQLIIITVDVCLLDENTADIIREKVAEKLMIPVDNVMLNVSHTHSGPRTMIDPSNSDSMESRTIKAYMAEMAAKIVSICSQASAISLKGMVYSTTFTASVGYNRRYTIVNENGNDGIKMLFSLWWNPGHETNGVVDNNIPVLVVERVDEKDYDSYFSQSGYDRIVIFNVPAHPVVLGEDSRYVSADYPGATRRCIESTLGNGTRAMFLLGACGNVNPFFACQNNPKAVEILGNAIGYGICASLSRRREIEFDGLNAESEIIKPRDGVHDKRVVTQVFRIGKSVISAISCECFTELGIRIRNGSGFDQTLVAANSNGGCGYIPDREAFKTAGGYELQSAADSGFDEDLLDKIADSVTGILNRI